MALWSNLTRKKFFPNPVPNVGAKVKVTLCKPPHAL